MTSFTISTGRKRGDFVLRDADGRYQGSLNAGWTLRRARVQTADGTWAIRRHGWRQVQVVAGERLLVALGPDQVNVPGPGPQPEWTANRDRGGWRGSLRRRGTEIQVRLTAPGARQGQVQVTGEWEQLDLVVLVACFVLVLHHRRRAVVAASGT